MREAEIQRQIMIAFGARADMRIWRANTGVAYSPDGRQVRFGIPGQPDIMGLMLPTGRWLGIEVKSATGRQSLEQKCFQAMIEAFGGLYILARSVDEVHLALSRQP